MVGVWRSTVSCPVVIQLNNAIQDLDRTKKAEGLDVYQSILLDSEKRFLSRERTEFLISFVSYLHKWTHVRERAGNV